MRFKFLSPLRFLKFAFKDRVIIIATKEKTIQIKILGIVQFMLIVIVGGIAFHWISKYNRYKNYHNYAVILEENDNLKAEHVKLRKKFADYDDKANKLNEYLENVVKNKGDIKASKPVKKNYKTVTVDEMVGQMHKHELYAYAAIDARKKDVSDLIKKIGISNISYNKLVKTAKISQESATDTDSVIASVSDDSSVGGIDEAVETIKIVKNAPFLRVNLEKINDKNFDREVNKMIVTERTLNSLPFGLPTKSKYRITSTYGFRQDPVSNDGKLRVHRGIDMVIEDEKILATKEGVVVFAGVKSGYGKCVDIEHKKEGVPGSVITHYAHLDSLIVSKGQSVKAGDIIGMQGNTGRSTGPHLHYEIQINKQSVNPMKFMNVTSLS